MIPHARAARRAAPLLALAFAILCAVAPHAPARAADSAPAPPAGARAAGPIVIPGASQPAAISPAALPPGVTPQQVGAAGEAIKAGAPVPPEAQKLLESRPELKEQLPEEVRKKLEEKEPEAGKPPAKPEAGKAPAVAEQPPALPPYDWRTSVYVGGLFSKRLHENEVRALSHFGHELFAPKAGGFAALENMPVAPDYVVGPGDEIIVRMWGRMEGTQRMTVDRDGKIFFPKIGSLYVAGKTFSELKSFLKGKVSTIAEVFSDVTMGQMKGIRVSVIGEVRAPGWYNVSSLHTALQALFIAGGVKDIGSLRRIELRRNGRVAETIDLYDFLLRGETRSDTTLLQGDAVFVPVVGKLVAISGEVRRPAIYELKDEKSLTDLVRMAGGFAPSAYKRRVQVERLEGHFAKIVLDADAEEIEKGNKDFGLSDGDIVRVLPIVFADVNAVTLEGNVVRPGKYELKPGMTIGSLLPDVNAFLPETYFDYALLTRLVPPDMRKEVIPVNLRAIVLEKKKEADVPLAARDTLTVFPRSAFKDAPRASISGEVRKPGTFDLRKGARVSDLVKLAGDLTKSAYLPKAEILRIDEKRSFHTIYFDLGKAMEKDPANDLLLEDEDQVRIHSIWETRYKKTVTASGELNAPGEYVLTEGMKLSDLIFRAGGFKESSYTKEAELVRRQLTDEGVVVKTEAVVVYPEKALRKEAEFDIALRPHDTFVVRQIPTWARKYDKYVTASGDVFAPGDFVLTDGMKLSDLLYRAGGLKESAYAKEAELVRRQVTPGGDLVRTETLTVSPERILAGDATADVALKQFDLLVVHRIPDWAEKITVILSGEVRFPGAYAVRKGERLSSVIARAGGFTQDAYLKAAQFTRVSTQKSQQEAIDRLIEDLELQIAEQAQAASTLDKEDIEANRELQAARRSLIAQLRKARAKGRVVIGLSDPERLKGSSADVLLEDGDTLFVPKKTNVVNVVGRVYNPTGVVYDPANDRLGYYLSRVGGPTESADRDHIFLLKADGSVVTRDNVEGGFFLFGDRGLMSAKVEPGDSIVVPEKLVQARLMKDVKDITQILYQIAVTAGVLIVAF